MNMILRELRANRKSLIIWSISMTLLILVGMVKYSAIEATGQSANELFNQLPEAMKSILGTNGLDLTSIGGYYAIFFLYFMLLAGVHSILLGAVIISKEERDKTADFLFVKPVPRNKIITSKLIATLIQLIVFNLVTLIASIVIVAKYNKGESINQQIVQLMIALFILQLVFASIGLAISALVQNTKKATSLATVFLLSTFMLSVAIDLYDKIAFLKYITPFKYVNAADIMGGGAFELPFMFFSALIIIGGITITYHYFKKRDLHV